MTSRGNGKFKAHRVATIVPLSDPVSTGGNVRHLPVGGVEIERARVVELVPVAFKPPRIPVDPVLLDMLTYMRPHLSAGETEFITKFIDPVTMPGGKDKRYWRDEDENLYLMVGNGQSPMMWACHVDTMHATSGRQDVLLAPDGLITQEGGSCLGADDGTGVYILLRMIKAGVPGLYVFHRGEERGCIGSRGAVSNFKDFYAALAMVGLPIKACVSFDRGGNDEIITHQRGSRCCSDAFAVSFGDAIGLGHKPSAKGVYTDSAEYVGIIGECANVGVGYKWQHGPKEQQDGAFAMELAEAMCKFDEATLKFERMPGDVEASKRYRGYCATDFTRRGGNMWEAYTDDEPSVPRGNRQYAPNTDPKCHWVYSMDGSFTDRFKDHNGADGNAGYVHEDDWPEYVFVPAAVDPRAIGFKWVQAYYRPRTPAELEIRRKVVKQHGDGVVKLSRCTYQNSHNVQCGMEYEHLGCCVFGQVWCLIVWRHGATTSKCTMSTGHGGPCGWHKAKVADDARKRSNSAKAAGGKHLRLPKSVTVQCGRELASTSGNKATIWRCKLPMGHTDKHHFTVATGPKVEVLSPLAVVKPASPYVGGEFGQLVNFCRLQRKAVHRWLREYGAESSDIEIAMTKDVSGLAMLLHNLGATLKALKKCI